MAQLNGLTDVRILLINNVELPGFLKINEQGHDEDTLEVPENGTTGLIYTGQRKAIQMELEFLWKRDGIVEKYLKDWQNSGSEARDIVEYHTDKTGKIENAFARIVYPDCELGPIKWPDFDQGSRKTATIKFSCAPGGPPQRKTL